LSWPDVVSARKRPGPGDSEFPHPANPEIIRPATLKQARAALQIVRREIVDLTGRTEVHPLAVGSRTARADHALNHLRYLDSQRRPLRILRAGVLQALYRLAADRAWGYPTFAEFVEQEFGLSERGARELLDEADRFEADPHLAWAYESGRVGAGQARLIHRFATDTTREAWIARAASVTLSQLEREVRLLERIDRVTPFLRPGDPFPIGPEPAGPDPAGPGPAGPDSPGPDSPKRRPSGHRITLPRPRPPRHRRVSPR